MTRALCSSDTHGGRHGPQRVEHVIEFDTALKHRSDGANVIDAIAVDSVVKFGEASLSFSAALGAGRPVAAARLASDVTYSSTSAGAPCRSLSNFFWAPLAAVSPAIMPNRAAGS